MTPKLPDILRAVVEFARWIRDGHYRKIGTVWDAPEVNPPFFIIGSGRSGTTLLRAILTTHQDLCIPPESYVLGPTIRRSPALRVLPWPLYHRAILGFFEEHDEFHTWGITTDEVRDRLDGVDESGRSLGRVIHALYREYAASQGKPEARWGDKTPLNTFHLREIDQAFRGAQFIHLVRDGRDVVASYRNAGLYESLDEACNRWEESVTESRDFGTAVWGSRFLELRYEDLVHRPEEKIREVCEFLSVDFQGRMLQFWKRADELGDTHYDHHQGVHQSITTDSVGRWEERLSASEADMVEERLGPLLRDLNYL